MMIMSLFLGLIILALLIMVVVSIRAIHRQTNREDHWISRKDEHGRVSWEKASKNTKSASK